MESRLVILPESGLLQNISVSIYRHNAHARGRIGIPEAFAASMQLIPRLIPR